MTTILKTSSGRVTTCDHVGHIEPMPGGMGLRCTRCRRRLTRAEEDAVVDRATRASTDKPERVK